MADNDTPAPATRYELAFEAAGQVHESAEAQRQWVAAQAEHTDKKENNR